MNTRILMTTSAVILGAAGILLSFLPNEFLSYINAEPTQSPQLLTQIMGALYFAFGMLNWMSKGSLIGGIYNRPIAVANFAHFAIAALALAKGVLSDPDLPSLLWGAAVVYGLLAVVYGIILFRHPLSEAKPA